MEFHVRALSTAAFLSALAAVTTFMVFAAEHGEAARFAMMWLLGSLSGANRPSVPIAEARCSVASPTSSGLPGA